MIEINPSQSHETFNEKPSFSLVIARHAAYYDPRSEAAMKADNVPEQEIRAKLGHLTKQGKEQARKFGVDILEQAIADGDDTDITFIASTQPYDSPAYPDAPWSGKRAEETSDQAITAITDKLDAMVELGLIRADQIRIASPKPEKTFTKGERPNERLIEREVYLPVNKIGESMINRYRSRTEQVLDDEAKAGVRVTSGYTIPTESTGSGFDNFDKREKELWSRGEQDIDRFAEAMSAETSTDVSDRVMGVVDDLNELATLHAEREPNRKLVVVLVSHDAVIGAVTSKGMGADTPVIPNYMEHIDIAVTNGVALFEQNDTIYERELN